MTSLPSTSPHSLEALVRGEYRGSNLAAATHQLKEQHRGGVRDRQITDLIDYQEGEMGENS